MSESKASRTLLKSPPELWSEVSSATSLQRHMDQFGEIRITKLEPETAVAWEGEHARGTITLEASGWGTRVSLTAEAVGTGGADEAQPGAARQAEPGAPDRGEPPEPAVAAEPGALVEAEPAPLAEPGALVEPEPVGGRVQPEPAENPGPHAESEAHMPDTPISLERDQLGAATPKLRWTERLARAFKRWFGAPPGADADPGIHPPAPAPSPDPPTTSLVVPAPEPEQLRAFATPEAPEPERPAAVPSTPEPGPVVPEPERPAASSSVTLAPQPKPEPEPLPQIGDAPSAALDAALDSLGQAHHRPFSRA